MHGDSYVYLGNFTVTVLFVQILKELLTFKVGAGRIPHPTPSPPPPPPQKKKKKSR